MTIYRENLYINFMSNFIFTVTESLNTLISAYTMLIISSGSREEYKKIQI